MQTAKWIGAFAAFLGLSTTTSVPALAQGNAFLPPAGGTTLAVSHTFEHYETFWMGDVEVSDDGIGRVGTASSSVWLQTSFAEDVALVASLAYVDVRGDGLGGLRDEGIQDGMFLLRYRFLDRSAAGLRHTCVVGAGARLPGSSYDPDGAVALGDGTRDGLLRLVYQLQAPRFADAYLAMEGGYDARESAASDATTFGAELGATYRRFSLAGMLGGMWADGGTDIGDPGSTYPGLDEDWLRVGGKAYYRVSRTFGLALSGFTTLTGRNTGVSSGISTSLVLDLPAST
jgi:hypothetical protein